MIPRPTLRHPDDRAIARLAVPALAALTADPLYSLIDTALVGNLGTSELGAVALGTAAFTASFWLFSFLAYGVTPKVAQALGSGNERAAADVGVQALLIAVLAGALVTLLGLAFAPAIVSVLGGSGEVSAFAVPYLRIRIVSAPFVLLALVGHGWLRGAQDTRTPMIVAVSGAALNAILDYLLIYPMDLGVNGAAWATLISQALVAAWFLGLLRPRLAPARRSLDVTTARSLLKVGIDLIVRTGSLLAALTIATSLAARMGKIELGAWQITSQIFLLLALTLDSLAIAAQALIGHHLGARASDSARRIANRLLELGLAIGTVLGLALIALATPIADLFTNDPEVIRETARLIRLFGAIQPLAGLAFTLDGILIGALVTRFLAFAMVGCSILFVTVGVLAYALEWGTPGLFAGAATWMVARVVTTGAYYLSPRWT